MADDVATALTTLRQAADPRVASAIEALIGDPLERRLNRVNVLDFAKAHDLDETRTIGGFLQATRLRLFDMSWNVLCPGCGGVLSANTTLKSVDRSQYNCSLCSAGYEPTLDEMVEVSFTISPRVRSIAAHDPDRLPFAEYFRQIFWACGINLPDEFEHVLDDMTLERLELPPHERAIVSLHLEPQFLIVFDPITHAAQFLDVKGEPTRERQAVTVVLDTMLKQNDTITLRPGPLRLTIENRSDSRTLPGVWIANDALHDLLGQRKTFLTAKRLLSNQTFRDLYRTGFLGLDQRLKITSLTFMFTDLKGSTQLYDRVGDLAALELVLAHFRVIEDIVATNAGAVVKTIGDAVMATFATPQNAVAAALAMRHAMERFNAQHGGTADELILKIGLHQGACLAVTLNDRQDYFGQTVNVAARVHALVENQEIIATDSVVEDRQARRMLDDARIAPTKREHQLRGLAETTTLYVLP